MPHIVVVGAGFAGLNAAKVLARDRRAQITIVDRNNHHLFQPLLYQVAMAELSPGDIAEPIRAIFRRRKNVEALMGEVFRIEAGRKRIHTTAGSLDYDTLVLAPGSAHSYFGNDHWEERAPGLKTLEQATEIRRRVLLAFEAAECCADDEQRQAQLTFVVVGGGPTGVELAGAIGEMARYTLRRDFRRIDPTTARVLLVEGGPGILGGFDEKLSQRAIRDLGELGVQTITGSMVSDINADGVQAGELWIPARTVLWAAGVSPSPLGGQLDSPRDKQGRVIVAPDLSVPGHPDIFVAGDLANFSHQGDRPLPGLASVAVQQGRFIGRQIRRDLDGKPRQSFHYRDKGVMATIGQNKALAQIGPLRFAGFPAWLAWVFIHIYSLTGFRNRVAVMFEWAWMYFTHRRGTRLILGKDWRFHAKPEERQGDDQ